MGLKWSMVKRIVNSSYAKLTILVPVIGWVLVADDQAAKLLARATDPSHSLQISWKIYALHVGLSIFGMGVGIFYLICPSAIKFSNDYTEFAEKDQRTITSSQLDVYSKALEKAKIAVPTSENTGSLAFPQQGSENGREVWLRRNQDLVLKTQYAFYQMENERWPLAILFTLAILIAGGALTAIPSLITLWGSFRHLLEIFSR